MGTIGEKIQRDINKEIVNVVVALINFVVRLIKTAGVIFCVIVFLAILLPAFVAEYILFRE